MAGVAAGWSGAGDFFEEGLIEEDAGFEVPDGEVFVRGVGLTIREGETEEEGFDAEDVAEALNDGDAAAFADEGGFAWESAAEGAAGGEAEAAVGVHGVGFAAVADFDFEPDGIRGDGLEVGADFFEDVGGVLIGDEAEGEFGEGGAWDDGFGAFALIAAADAVDFGGGAGPAAFVVGVSGFAPEFGDTGEGEGFFCAAGEFGPCFAFPCLDWADGVVEAGDEDAAVGVVEAGDEFGEDGIGVGDAAAEDAAVEVDGGAVDGEFDAGDAAEPVGEGGNAFGDHAGVGDGDDVAGEVGAVGVEERLEGGAADFFFAFEEEGEVEGEVAVLGEGGGDAGDVGEELAFIVGAAAGVDSAVLDAWFEGRGDPLVERVDWLDVVVAVDEEGGAAGLVLIFGDEDRVAGGRVEDSGETHADEFGLEPFGAVHEVAGVG